MKKIQKNKIQIYLSDEIKEKFNEFCEQHDLKASSAGLKIISEYFTEKPSESSVKSNVEQELDLIHKEIRKITSEIDNNRWLAKKVIHLDSFLTNEFPESYRENYSTEKKVIHSSEHSESNVNQDDSPQEKVIHSTEIKDTKPNIKSTKNTIAKKEGKLYTDKELKEVENLPQNKSTITRWRQGRGKIPEHISQNYKIVGTQWKLIADQ